MMRPPLRLTSPDNPRLKAVLHLRKNRDRRDANCLIAEGTREISRAIAANLPCKEVFWSPDLSNLSLNKLLELLPLPDSTSIYEVTPPLFQKIAYLDKPEGILALFEPPTWSLDKIPAPTNTDLFLIAQGIEKPGNLGAIARTALAAGVTALLLADENVDPFNPNAIRSSTGAVFTLPIISSITRELLDFLETRKVRIYAATPNATQLYTEMQFTHPTAIAIGPEDKGLNIQWLTHAHPITIPMKQGLVDSLNASTSAAVLLFEVVRQRAISQIL
jgi:TrmH family RNA methyltransferase